MGYDTRLFNERNDSRMITRALAENRIILTRDTQIMKRRVITRGPLKAVFIQSDDPRRQLRQVIENLKLDCQFRPFRLCLECNRELENKRPEEVATRVPSYVFQTQTQFMECPACHRIYWRGTHWRAMNRRLEQLSGG